jgi:glycosyltransferase involved in cell wall biosynthesis
MLVSIIVPILDAERYLAAAVASVRQQPVSDWELLLVDDGSKDRSLELARRLAEEEPVRIRCLEHEDHRTHGASATRNLGLQAAGGEFVAFLDADDVWLPGKLAHQLELLRSEPRVAMTFGRVRYFAEEGESVLERDQPFGPLHEGVYAPPDLAVEFLRNADIYPCPSAALARRLALLELGGFEQAMRQVRTDLALWMKITTHFLVYADPTIVARYRQHPGSSVAVMFRDGTRYRRNELAFYHWLLPYLDELPRAIREPLEPLACQRMFRLSQAELLSEGKRHALVWRAAILPRLWHYRAFRREARLLRYLLPSFLTGGAARAVSGDLRG